MQDKKNSKFIVLIDCPEKIPCNPCEDVCPKKVIKVGKNITNIPKILNNFNCIGCGFCVASCPGLAIYLIDLNYTNESCGFTFAYEFNDIPKIGQDVVAVDVNGKKVCDSKVISVKKNKKYKDTTLVSIAVPKSKYKLVKGIKKI